MSGKDRKIKFQVSKPFNRPRRNRLKTKNEPGNSPFEIFRQELSSSVVKRKFRNDGGRFK